MLVQLGTGHMLILISIANVAAKFGAVELGVDLELAESLPDDLAFTLRSWASMWELAEIDTILENFVYWLQKVASALAIWAAEVKIWSDSWLIDHSSW